jgi:hypothetical protein
MIASKMPTSFQFEEIADFDARRGLKRCAVPGVGTHAYNQVGNADFWRNAAGDVLVRFESSGYRYSFCARTGSGAAIADDQFEEFTDRISELLLDWLCDGVDDAPEA